MVSSAARPLQDQKTLVTGGSSGIGAATARAFARAGAAVGVNYRSKASAAEELVREIRDQGGEAIALKADVSRDDEVRAMFDWLVEAFGRIDILVANAGIQKDAAITNMSLEDWRAVLDINLTGQFLCVREAIRANNALCPRLELTRNVGYHRSGSWIRHCTAERRPHQPSSRAPRVKPQGGRKPRALRGAACRL
jgi:glucose 1-dehydrogenase